jgi:hypothetical protein
MKKFLALFDLHFGYEFGNVKGNRVKRTTHNLDAIKAVKKFAFDFGPDILILGGDQLNCGPVSHWHKGKPRLDEGFRLKDEYTLLNEHILHPFYDVERKIWLTGNHEQWIEDYINEHPSLEGLLEPKKVLCDLNNNWEYYSQGEIVKIGKLHFTHGDTILGAGKYINPAQQLVNQTRVNIRCGHLHSFFAATDINPIMSSDYHTGIVVPGMCSTNPFYVKNRPTRFITGFLYGYIWPDGNFNDYVVILNKNKFVINGVKYE